MEDMRPVERLRNFGSEATQRRGDLLLVWWHTWGAEDEIENLDPCARDAVQSERGADTRERPSEWSGLQAPSRGMVGMRTTYLPSRSG
jgi:hypothetical protein